MVLSIFDKKAGSSGGTSLLRSLSFDASHRFRPASRAVSFPESKPGSLELFDEDVAPADCSPVGLQLDGAGRWEWTTFVKVVLQWRFIDDKFVIEVHGDDITNHLDLHAVPLAEGFVGENQGVFTRAAFFVVPKSSGAFVGTVFPFSPFFGRVPDLDLRNGAEVDAAVGLCDGLVLQKEDEVFVVLIGGEVEPMSIVHKFVSFDAPMLVDVSEAFLFLGREFIGGKSLPFCGVLGSKSPPAGEVFFVEERLKAFGCFWSGMQKGHSGDEGE